MRTGNGITRIRDGHNVRSGAERLGGSRRDKLLELCRQRLDGFRPQRGEEVHCCAEACGYAPRSRHRTPISEISEISEISNLQALCC